MSGRPKPQFNASQRIIGNRKGARPDSSAKRARDAKNRQGCQSDSYSDVPEAHHQHMSLIDSAVHAELGSKAAKAAGSMARQSQSKLNQGSSVED